MSIDFNNLPDINFVDKDVETLLANMIEEYEKAYFEQTGEVKTLAQGDPIRIWIYSQALRIYAAYQLIDYSAKQNLLKYAEGDFLDNLAARIGLIRLIAAPAITTVRFTLSAIQSTIIPIPQGTRVSTSNNIFFATKVYSEIPIGDTYIDVEVECLELGTIGNDFTANQINTLVDPIAYVASVSNLDTSQGGADIESDESLRERIFMASESFSVAGPSGAYEYFAKQYSSQIDDVKVTSSSPGEVDIRVILTNGQIPSQTIIDGLSDYLNDKSRRPLTDQVIVQAPTQVNYDITCTYYIRKSDESFAQNIQEKVDKAVLDYAIWQRAKISRDINPSELITQVISAGAKRIEIIAPVYTLLQDTELAIESSINVTYGGLEDD